MSEIVVLSLPGPQLAGQSIRVRRRGHKHQDVPLLRLRQNLLRLSQSPLQVDARRRVDLIDAFSINDVDGIGAARDPQLLGRLSEKVVKDPAVHGGGRDDDPKVLPLRKQVLGESQQNVGVDGPLVDFVEDEAGVVGQEAVLDGKT